MKFLEIESKYKVDENLRLAFKQEMEKYTTKFAYVESTDLYYVKGNEFLRYRFRPDSKASELTFKTKTVESNNIVRKEVNLNVDKNNADTVENFCNIMGFIKNFKIVKYVDIYEVPEAIIAFYTVKDEDNIRTTFLEIEVQNGQSEEQALTVIKDWEEKLKPLGISTQKRLKKSLFEMYRKNLEINS